MQTITQRHIVGIKPKTQPPEEQVSKRFRLKEMRGLCFLWFGPALGFDARRSRTNRLHRGAHVGARVTRRELQAAAQSRRQSVSQGFFLLQSLLFFSHPLISSVT